MELLVHDILASTAGRVPSRTAVSYRDTQLTYAELQDRAARAACALTRLGLGPGARVGWWGTTSVDLAALFFGVASIGAAFVPLNPRFNTAEAATIIEMAAPDLMVTDADHPG